MNLKPKMVIAGGSGFFGNHLVAYFKNTYQITVLTRGKTQQKEGVNYQHWNAETKSDWVSVIGDAEVLINLTGKSINCRFTDANKKELLSSRIDSTKVLAEAIESVQNPPKIWLNASAGAMYKTKEIPSTEEDINFGNDFLAQMSLAWEKAFFEKELSKTKRAAMRISLILGKDGGVFPVWKKITSLFLGGKAGCGKQIVSWIHVDDAIRAVEFIIKKELEGAINFSTNQPISNNELMKTLRGVLGISLGIPAPAFGIKLFSRFIGTEPSLLLDSVNFVPKKLLDRGFHFQFTTINEALEDLS